MLELHLTHANDKVASGAAEGLIASHGLNGYRERIWDRLKARGLDGPTESQRHHFAVNVLDGEVRNGGLSQYFFNSGGGDWRIAVAGLEAMGSKERLAILQEAIAMFGKDGPSTDRDGRMKQLSGLVKANEKLFDALEVRYYKSGENLDVLMTRYVLKNPDAFK